MSRLVWEIAFFGVSALAAVLARDGREFRYLSSAQLQVVKREVAKAIRRDGGANESDWKRIGQMCVEFVRSNLESQKNPGGSAFRALDPKYAAAKRARGEGATIGRATGDLEDGLRARVRKL